MRVAIITDRVYPFYMGGYEYSLFQYANILAQNNDVFVFTSFDNDSKKSSIFGSSVNLVKITNRTSYVNKRDVHSTFGSIKYYFAILKQKREIKDFDIVILNSIPYIYGSSFLKLLKKNNLKLVVVFYEAWFHYLSSFNHNPIMGRILKRRIRMIALEASFIISISRSTTKSLVENYSVPDIKVMTIPIGIEKRTENLPKMEDRRFDLIFVGRLRSIKRIGDILESMKILLRERRDLKLAIVGDGNYRDSILDSTERLGLRDYVKMTCTLEDDDKFSILRKSKIFILPSEREGLSVATLEAMQMGCIPIVARPKYDEVFGLSHYFIDGFNGFEYPVGDIESLAKTINRLLGSTDLQSEMSKNARETASNYTWDKIAILLKEALDKMYSFS
jgi:glycosyltransferase involved in cell wall biosynthesis